MPVTIPDETSQRISGRVAASDSNSKSEPSFLDGGGWDPKRDGVDGYSRHAAPALGDHMTARLEDLTRGALVRASAPTAQSKSSTPSGTAPTP